MRENIGALFWSEEITHSLSLTLQHHRLVGNDPAVRARRDDVGGRLQRGRGRIARAASRRGGRRAVPRHRIQRGCAPPIQGSARRDPSDLPAGTCARQNPAPCRRVPSGGRSPHLCRSRAADVATSTPRLGHFAAHGSFWCGTWVRPTDHARSSSCPPYGRVRLQPPRRGWLAAGCSACCPQRRVGAAPD